jgi:hypothetical protein
MSFSVSANSVGCPHCALLANVPVNDERSGWSRFAGVTGVTLGEILYSRAMSLCAVVGRQ